MLEQRGPWKIDTSLDGEVFHIRPRNDLWWHPLEVGCWCEPIEETARTADGCLVLVYRHRAADGRE